MNKKQIIALQGQDKTGKTETLKKLIQKLLSVSTKVTDQGKFTSRMKNKHWDVWAIFEYEGMHIAITTRGDAVRFIEDDFNNMDEFAHQAGFEIDVYICAIHTTGKTVKYVDNKAAMLGIKPQIYGKATYNCSTSSNEENIQSQMNDWQSNIIFANL